jgi:cation diffusion facilitator CzcD-associated flavoprotein CzcO
MSHEDLTLSAGLIVYPARGKACLRKNCGLVSFEQVITEGSYTVAGATKSAAILGAGVAGLTAAKTLKQYGLKVTILEAKSELGGVWANNYKSLCVLEPYQVYGLPDWPWPPGTPLYPPASNVRSYLQEYARHFGIFDHIRFNTRVLQATPGGQGRWKIETESETGRESKEYDFFIMAPGMFNLPRIPAWPGMENFEGKVIHSSQFHTTSQIKNRNVAIVGFSRSAMDIAVDIVEDSASVTVLHRSVRWPVPEKILGLIRNHVLLFARWPALFAPPWIRPTRLAALLHTRGAFVVNLFWGLFEFLLSNQFRLKNRKLMPDRPIKLDLFTNLYITPRRFFTMLGDGVIHSIRCKIESFYEAGVCLASGQKVAADVVICATGWRQDYSFLPSSLLDRIYDEDGMHLYRHMVHPEFPGLAFVGGVQGINSATLYAIQATWVARYLTGEFSLPSAEVQLDEIKSLKQWTESFVTKRANRSQILNLHQLPYIDDLMTDMGMNKRRKNLLLDQFVPYKSVDYETAVATTNPR